MEQQTFVSVIGLQKLFEVSLQFDVATPCNFYKYGTVLYLLLRAT
jgi:hypothetical protein